MARSKKAQKSQRKRKRSTEGQLPETQKNDLLEPIKGQSPTAVASEALRTGVSPYKLPNTPGVPGEMKLKGGDPDVDVLENEYSGEEMPGATTPTPDQSLVDAIGRAYG